MENNCENNKNRPHEGHRQRLLAKFNNYPDSLSAHEIIEVMLYFSIKQKNVNTEAHDLIQQFGSVRNIIKADKSDLTKIKGIGGNTASFIKLVGHLCDVILESKLDDITILNIENLRSLLVNFYKNQTNEYFLCFHLDKNNKLISKQIFTSDKTNSVNFNVAEISKGIISNKPHSIIISHNHTTGDVRPSLADDTTTQKLCLLLQMHGINLYDHIIVSGNKIYSYKFSSNLLNGLKQFNCTLDDINYYYNANKLFAEGKID